MVPLAVFSAVNSPLFFPTGATFPIQDFRAGPYAVASEAVGGTDFEEV